MQLYNMAKNHMTTSISRITDNAFQINRKGTKHLDEFKYNTFSRPVMATELIRLVRLYAVNQPSLWEIENMMVHINSTDYHTNFSQDVTLDVRSGSVTINFKYANWMNVSLDRAKFMADFKMFTQDVFSTDYNA